MEMPFVIFLMVVMVGLLWHCDIKINKMTKKTPFFIRVGYSSLAGAALFNLIFLAKNWSISPELLIIIAPIVFIYFVSRRNNLRLVF